MNKKQGDHMQFSLEKRPEKRKLIHPTPDTYQWMDSAIKLGIRSINSIRNFFICLKMFVM